MMNGVYCLSSSEPRANAILTGLRESGFTSEISVLLEDHVESKNLSLREDAARGAKIGGVVGALLALTIPGIGPALAVGPLVAALGGAAAGGAVGGLAGGSGALAPLELPEEVVTRLKERFSKGEILIAVHSDDPGKRRQALMVFQKEGAEFIYESRDGNREQIAS
jgi:hypothetical protein